MLRPSSPRNALRHRCARAAKMLGTLDHQQKFSRSRSDLCPFPTIRNHPPRDKQPASSTQSPQPPNERVVWATHTVRRARRATARHLWQTA
jgi:hypothetical protein